MLRERNKMQTFEGLTQKAKDLFYRLSTKSQSTASFQRPMSAEQKSWPELRDVTVGGVAGGREV